MYQVDSASPPSQETVLLYLYSESSYVWLKLVAEKEMFSQY
jgi:hypothetical protein